MTQPHTLPNLPRAFGDYPLDTLPPVPAHWTDSSWHNDTCPSFIIGDSLCVFLDYADVTQREIEDESERYSLLPMSDGMHNGEPPILHSNDWQAILAAAIGETFAANLRELLSAEEFAEMMARNVAHVGDGVCASHDFCDANMPMADAFQAVTGREPLADGIDTEQGQADCTLWNAAWEHAKARHLTAAAPLKGN